MQYALELKNVHYAYHTLEGETYALKDITFSVREGEFIALVGPSGCGKSTLLHLIAGLLTPEKGLIKINGSYHPDNTSGIGYMLQKDELLEWRTIYQNVLLGLEIQHALTARSRALARALLTQYGLNAFANAKPSELSGGMRQRAALIRTLVLKPDIMLLDEPFSALDYQTRLNVSDDIGQIIKKEKKTAILEVWHVNNEENNSQMCSLESGSADENIEIMKAYMCKQRGMHLGSKISREEITKKVNQSKYEKYCYITNRLSRE